VFVSCTTVLLLENSLQHTVNESKEKLFLSIYQGIYGRCCAGQLIFNLSTHLVDWASHRDGVDNFGVEENVAPAKNRTTPQYLACHYTN